MTAILMQTTSARRDIDQSDLLVSRTMPLLAVILLVLVIGIFLILFVRRWRLAQEKLRQTRDDGSRWKTGQEKPSSDPWTESGRRVPLDRNAYNDPVDGSDDAPDGKTGDDDRK